MRARGGTRHAAGLSSWGAVRRNGRDVLRAGATSFLDHHLLIYASALAFQVLFALIPLALATLALLALVDLSEVWSSQIAPAVKERVQRDAFSVVDRTVQQIFGEKRLSWLTFGLVLALWQVSVAVWTTMPALNAMYGTEENRSWRRQFLVSLGLALAIAPPIVAAAIVTQLGPGLDGVIAGGDLVDAVVLIARWPVAVALLTFAVWLLIRYAPASPQPLAWAGVGAAFVVVSWILASLGFGFYLGTIASYQSVFGSLASAIVLMTYLYLSSLALFFGVQLDACLREYVRGDTLSNQRDRRSRSNDRASRPTGSDSILDRGDVGERAERFGRGRRDGDAS